MGEQYKIVTFEKNKPEFSIFKSSAVPGKLKFYTIIAAFGGFLIGFDIANLFSSKAMLLEYFSIDSKIAWLVVFSGVPGFLVGIISIGKLADKFGRCFMFKIIAALLFVSLIGRGLANNSILYVSFQLFNGLAIGSLSVLSPLYISEISPSQHKFKLSVLFPFFALIGLLLGFAGSFIFDNLEVKMWRWLILSECIPTLLFMVFIPLLPRSPNWLVSRGLHGEAYLVLSKLNPKLPGNKIDELVNEIDKSIE